MTAQLITDFATSLMQRETHGRLCRTMFPEDAHDPHLERCVRVLPLHMGLPGGFFIAAS